MRRNSKRGFTLIELLVVISIIGILATLVLARYSSVEKSVRDTQRKSDLNQYRIALETYANAHNGLYPIANSCCASTGLCGAAPNNALVPYLSQCPNDPLFAAGCPCVNVTGEHEEAYVSGPTGSSYLLYIWGGIESVAGNTWVVCWNGKVGMTTNSWSAIAAFCPLP